MEDAYLYFSKAQEVAALSVNSENILKVADIEELGRGRQKFVEIWSDGNFTDEDYLMDIKLMVGATDPPTTHLMEIASQINGDGAAGSGLAMSEGGLIAKVPLPSINMDDYVMLQYVCTTTAPTAGGHLTAKIGLW